MMARPWLIAAMVGVALFSAGTAHAVEVFMYRPPNNNWSYQAAMPAGELGLVHMTIALAKHEVNGEGSVHLGTQEASPNPDTWHMNYVTEEGNGIPDAWELGVFEYAYLNPSAPGHALAKAAFDFNMASLYGWTSNGDPCSGAEMTMFVDFLYRDEYSNHADNPPDILFPTCTTSAAQLLFFAAHASVSEHAVGPHGYVSGYWVMFNRVRQNPIDFNTDPRFDRSAVALFGENGDLNGDGITNKEKHASFRRAWDAGWRPDGLEAALAAIPDSDPIVNTKRNRTEQDYELGAYIDLVMFTDGYHPADPNAPPPPPPPPPTNFRVASQSQSQWFLATPGTPLELFVTVASAEGAVTYQWYKDGAALSASDPHYSGVQTANLTVNPPLIQAADGGNYWCVMTDESAGKATISSAPIEITIFAEGELPAAGAIGLALLGSALALAALRRARR